MNESILPITSYRPGRFEYLMHKPFTLLLWKYLTTTSNIDLMGKAVSENKPAIFYLLKKLEKAFNSELQSPDYPPEEISTFVNNMILQIMEAHGFKHVACSLCPQAQFIKSSGMFRKLL